MENKEKKTTLENPVDEYYTGKFPKQKQPFPGVESNMNPMPDAGEESYVGHDRLKRRKALITGGDSGIGRAVAIAFAREGADVAINYLPSERKDAESLQELLEKEGRKIVLLPGDLSDESFCKNLVKNALDALGGLDILVLNAAMQQAVKDIRDLSSEQLRKTFEINVFSMFWMMKEAIPHLPAGSSVITTSSIQAGEPGDALVDYASTKAAIEAFTQALAKQVAHKGIRINAVAPGPIWTALQVAGGQPQERIPEFGHNTPLGRAGQPAELAGVYVFLASNEASYVTAEVYGVAGGNHRA